MKRRVCSTLLVGAAIAVGILPMAGTGAVRSSTAGSTAVPWQFPGPAGLDSPVAPGVTSAPCPRNGASVCIYAIGGYAWGGPNTPAVSVASVFADNPASNDWMPAASLPLATRGAAVTTAPCVKASPPRMCVYLLGGVTGDGESRAVRSYDPTTNTWTAPFLLPFGEDSLAAAAAPCRGNSGGTCIYAIGGENGQQSVNGQMLMFDTLTGTWTAATSVHTYSGGQLTNYHREFAMASTAPCVAHTSRVCIYLIGGSPDGVTPKRTVLMYDPSEDNGNGSARPGPWTRVANLPAPVAGGAAFTAPCRGHSGSCVFAIGGWNVGAASRTILASVEEFDPASDTWSDLRPLNVARLDLGAAAIRCPSDPAAACFFAVGGDDGTNDTTATTEELQPNSPQWQLSAALEPPRNLAGVVAADCTPQPAKGVHPAQTSKGTCIYSIGGMAGSAQATAAVDMYDPSSGFWRELADAPAPIAAAGVTTGPCPKGGGNTCIYVVGGYSPTSATITTSAYLFEPDTGTWQAIAPLPVARALLAAASAPCRGATGRICVYALDGSDSLFNVHGDVFMYDPLSNSWTSVAPALTADEAVAATRGPCAKNPQSTCLYLSPGFFGSSLEMYDPRHNAWLKEADSNVGSPAMTSGPCSNDPFRKCLWLTGGWEKVGVSHQEADDVQEFDPANIDGGSGLIQLQSLLRPRSGAGAASGPCPGTNTATCVYAVDGGTYQATFESAPDWSEALEMARPVRFTGSTFTVGAITVHPKHGTASISVRFDNSGLVTLTGKGVKMEAALVGGPESKTLTVSAQGHAAAILRKTGRVTVTVSVDFSSSAEPDHARSRRITLRRH